MASGLKHIASMYLKLLGLKSSSWFMTPNLLDILEFLRRRNFYPVPFGGLVLNTGLHPAFIPDLPISTPIPAVTNRLTALQETQGKLIETLREAQESYKKAADRHRRALPTFHVGDQVWLSTKNLKVHVPSAKLGQKFVGPFQILAQINPVAFRLKLPASMKIHPVFHISLLKPFHENTFSGRTLPPPPPVEVQGEEEYVVEKILDSRIY
ncbi:uncharacterized protein LOC120928330, partial [Rana temporaria]|uniref:uncharacterized protein LOC120910426 n=1 Tax=Rana temporaria TaxID=8407 RepID=UPI001AADEAAB